MLFSVDGAMGRVAVDAAVAAVPTPYGEYSTSNVGSVDAYGIGVDTIVGRESTVANANEGDGGVFASGRFLLGVTADEDEFDAFGVKLRTSRNAKSIRPNDCGVLVTLLRYEYGCGVCT